MTTSILHPTRDDLQRVFDFMLACDVAEYGAPDSDLGDLTAQWDEADLSRDAWISLDPAGALNGYALFSVTSAQRCDLDTYIFKPENPQELWQALYDLALARFHKVVYKAECQPGAKLVTYVNAANGSAVRNAGEHGFKDTKHHFRMQIDFEAPYPAPEIPAGCQVGTYTEDAEEELFNLIVSTFDWEGSVDFDREIWKKQVFRGGRADLKDFFLLRRDGRLVGAALCYDEGDLIWLKELAVTKSDQGTGLGSFMLRHVFSTYSQRGAHTVALGVVSTNPKAAAFYERTGMRRTREFVQFELVTEA